MNRVGSETVRIGGRNVPLEKVEAMGMVLLKAGSMAFTLGITRECFITLCEISWRYAGESVQFTKSKLQ